MSQLYQELNIKAVFLGNGNVGKTSLCSAITRQDIPTKYIPTIGSSISRKKYILEDSDLNTIVNLWDIGGQRDFSPLKPAFFKNTDVAVLMFDVSEPKDSIKDLREDYLEPLLSQVAECVVLIVGNKIDIEEKFDNEEIKRLLEEEHLNNLPILFTSALEGINVDNVIEYAIYRYFTENKRELRDNGLDVSHEDFLNTINRPESEMENIPINVNEINTTKIKTTSPIKVKEKREELEEIIESKKYQFLQERLDDLEAIQSDIKDNFIKNMSFIQESITNLKKIPIRFLIDEINGILSQLKTFKDDFQEKLNISQKIDEISEQETMEGEI